MRFLWFKKKIQRVVFVDMDGVLANYCAGWECIWRERYPNEYCPDMETLPTFYIEDMYPPEMKVKVRELDREPGYFLNLPEIPGAIEAMRELRSIPNVSPKICTSPVRSKFCIMEKYQWIEKHLGYEWLKDIITSKDKTVFRGEDEKHTSLVDDRPKIEGLIKKLSFEHILYRQPYNLNVRGKRSLTWNDRDWFIDELKHS